MRDLRSLKINITILLLFAFSLIANAEFTNSSAKDSVNKVSVPKSAPWFVERFRLSGGFFVPVSNTNVRVGIRGGIAGTQIDFEKDLGFDSGVVTFLSNFQWRVTRRSRINLNYYNIPRNSSHKLHRDITFRGQTYPVNIAVNSYFNTAIYQLSYGYAIIEKPKYEVGIMLGTHLVGGSTGISVRVNGGSGSASTDFGFTAPLPDLGLWGGYAFNDRFGMNLDVDYLSVTVGEIFGSIFAYNLLFLYRVIDKLDLSLGFSGLNCRVDIIKTRADGHLKWGYNGPSLGATYSFGKKSWKK